MGYFASAVNVVSSNPSVGPSSIINISFYYRNAQMSISAAKIITFFSILPSVNENSERDPFP